MAEVKEIVRQIGSLAGEVESALDAALAAGGAETRARLEALAAELERVRVEKDEALAARQEAEREQEAAEKRVDSLVQKLKEARQAAVDASEEAQRTLRRQLEALQGECDDARAELERERSVRKRLERGAATDEKRMQELEKALRLTRDEQAKSAAVIAAIADGISIQDLDFRVLHQNKAHQAIAGGDRPPARVAILYSGEAHGELYPCSG